MSRDWKKFFSNKNNYVVVLLIGVLFLVMLLPVGGKEDLYFPDQNGHETVEADSFGETLNYTQAYCRMLEERIEELLSGVAGIGESNVLITMEYSEEKFLEEGTLVKTQVPKVQGVMVVAEGAGAGNVDLEITRMIQALLDVDAHKIAIAKMETP